MDLNWFENVGGFFGSVKTDPLLSTKSFPMNWKDGLLKLENLTGKRNRARKERMKNRKLCVADEKNR